MNGSSVLKKVLPVICAIILIILVAVVVSAAKNGGKSPLLDKSDEDYVSVNEEISGKTYTYHLTRAELYEELKGNIGLSTAITLANKAILGNEIYKDGKSFLESITDEEIEKAKEEAIYGADTVIEDLTQEEKDEKIKDFENTMYTGYGYKTPEEINDHYRLVLGKKLYAKVALDKDIADADSDDPYFTDEKIDTYYDSNYNKSYWGLVVPFTSSDQVSIALQQLGIGVESSKWVEQTIVEKKEGSGVYEYDKGDTLSTFEVINAIMSLYNTVYGYKNEALVEGTVTPNLTDGAITSYSLSEGSDYGFIDCQEKVNALKLVALEIKALVTVEADASMSEDAKQEVLAKITAMKATLKEITDMLAFNSQVATISSTLDLIKASMEYDPSNTEAETPKDPTVEIENVIKALNEFESKVYVFNTDNLESKLYLPYDELYAYDSTLPSEFKNKLSAYVPYSSDASKLSANTGTPSWYTPSYFSSSPVYYIILKIKEADAPSLDDVKNEIIEKLKEEEITDEFVEKKMAALRAEYEFKIYDSEIETQYISAIKEYDVDYSKSKKKGTNVFSSIAKDDYSKEFTTEELFNYMDKTSGIATVLSELAYQRLMNNTAFNKYYDSEKQEWIGDEGEELRENILASIETQRLYFLSGSYTSYGYDPSTMTWTEFLQNVQGAKDEKELAFLNVYSSVSSDFMAAVVDYLTTDGEGKDLVLKTSYKDALASKTWELLQNRMQTILDDYFSCTGEHLLVSVYDTVNDQANSKNPIDPAKWTDEQKALAQELAGKVQEYLKCAEGTYAAKLQAVVDAYKKAPYAVKVGGEYVNTIDSNGVYNKYVLECAGCTIDLAKYKSAGLALKYESLGTFTNGKMVENFENAAKSIWEKDIADQEYNRITVYNDPIETEFGYHLYVNLGSAKAATYEAVVVDAEGNPVKETVDGEEEVKRQEQVLPSLYEIRLNVLLTALKAIDQTTLEEEDAAYVQAQIDELTPLLSDAAVTAMTTYSDSLVGLLEGSYFSTALQQSAMKALFANAVLNGSNYTKADLDKVIDINLDSIYKSNLTGLVKGDEELFDTVGYLVK